MMLLNTLVSLLLPRRQRFMIDVRASKRHFLKPPTGLLLTGEGLCHVECQGAPEFVGPADVKIAFHQTRIPGRLQAFSALPAVLASEVWSLEKGSTATSCSRLLDLSCPFNIADGFLLSDVFSVKMSRTTARSREVLILLSLFVVTFPTPPPIGSKHGMGSRDFRLSCADIFGVSGSR